MEMAMAEYYLNRGDAPFGDGVWEQIDKVVVEAAKSELAGRRLLHTTEPYGLGLKALPFADYATEEKAVEGVTMAASCVIPLTLIQSEFSLPVRDIAAYEQSGMPLDLGPVAKAAIACARQEDQLIFNGSEAVGVRGLFNTPGTRSIKLKAWDEVGAAVVDIIAAVTELDNAGLHGSYALALTPKSYNHLFRLYPQGNMTELEHARQIVTDGMVKAPAIAGGGVLLSTGGSPARLVIGQDLMAGFIGAGPGRYEFTVSETIALWLRRPEAVCVLK
jgi:uncharacterized linocin/CFP29 family protein